MIAVVTWPMPEQRPVRKPTPLSPEVIDQARRQLGLFETATRNEINQRYRRLAQRFHPDRCPEPEKPQCLKRFQQIANAYQLLKDFLRRYRYSLCPEHIRRDQEDPHLKHLRQFGLGLWPDDDEPLPVDLTHGTALRGDIRITAENVEWARRILDLGQLVSAHQLHQRYRKLAVQHHPDRQPPDQRSQATKRFDRIDRAYRLLADLLANYRYSFRPEDLRGDRPDDPPEPS